MDPRLYYITDYKWVRKPFYWDFGFRTIGDAKAAIDAYFPKSYYVILRGDFLIHFKIKKRRARRYIEITPINKALNPSKAYKRELRLQRIRGSQITPYRFKDIWEPQYERGKKRRQKIKMKDRNRIRNKILK